MNVVIITSVIEDDVIKEIFDMFEDGIEGCSVEENKNEIVIDDVKLSYNIKKQENDSLPEGLRINYSGEEQELNDFKSKLSRIKELYYITKYYDGSARIVVG